MKLLDTAKQNPGWTAVIALVAGIAGFFAGMDKIVYVWNSIPTAYAANKATQEIRSDFDRYIAQQQEEAKLERQRIELQAEYNERLLQLQQQQVQQQVPNAPVNAYQTEPFYREWDEARQMTWCCDSNDYHACDDQGLWYTCP